MKKVTEKSKSIQMTLNKRWTSTNKLVYTALLSTLATLLQSSGGYIPVVGFFISPLTTLPILLATIISIKYGLFSYMLTIILLFIIEPSELFIFPFTTGLLGLSLGWGFTRFAQLFNVLFISKITLFIGICIPLYILKFPVFGSFLSSSIHIFALLFIYIFSLLYCLLWIKISEVWMRRFLSFIH